MSDRPTFFSMPELPVVPLPQEGEALGSWVRAIAETYGLSVRDYCERHGIPRNWVNRNIDSDLLIQPPIGFLESISTETGVKLDIIKKMTFANMADIDLLTACAQHFEPCGSCTEAATRRALRPVELIFSRAPWRVVCPYHPPWPRPDEVAQDVDLAVFFGILREIIERLDQLAGVTPILVPITRRRRHGYALSSLIRLTHLLNAFMAVKLIGVDELRDLASFEIAAIFRLSESVPQQIPQQKRNGMAFSLALAWQLLTKPTTTALTLVNTRRTAAEKGHVDYLQYSRFIELVADIWPSDIAARFVTDQAVSRRGGWKHSAISRATTKHLQNRPEYKEKLDAAEWNLWTLHSAVFGFLYEPRSRFSKFDKVGPFPYKHVAARCRSTAAIAHVRTGAWQRRLLAWGGGLQRFERLMARKKVKAMPVEIHQPAYPPVEASPALVLAVETAIIELNAGSRMTSAKKRKKLIQKINRRALQLIEQLSEPES